MTLGVVQAVEALVVGLLLFAFAAHDLRRLQAQAPPRVNTEP
jgi:hypothetical protein